MQAVTTKILSYDSYQEQTDVLNAFQALKQKAGVEFTEAENDPLWTIYNILAQLPVKPVEIKVHD